MLHQYVLSGETTIGEEIPVSEHAIFWDVGIIGIPYVYVDSKILQFRQVPDQLVVVPGNPPEDLYVENLGVEQYM
jgi:hypothetical protein